MGLGEFPTFMAFMGTGSKLHCVGLPELWCKIGGLIGLNNKTELQLLETDGRNSKKKKLKEYP